MKYFICIVFLMCFVSLAFAQEPEVLAEDIELMFVGAATPTWISGGDAVQQYFTIDSITYSPEPVSTNITHTTKLEVSETWEAALWQPPGEPFRKVIVMMTIYNIESRDFVMRIRNRYPGDDDPSDWSELSDIDKVIGKPNKLSHNK